MPNQFGISLYLSSFQKERERLENLGGSKYSVFTSFHIQEEMNQFPDFKAKAFEMCQWLNQHGFKIIGDVSPKTLQFFNYENVLDFAKDFHLDVIRIDYGFSDEAIIEIAKQYPISFNASTVNLELAKQILAVGSEVYALHNFYPRPETGLDEALFRNINQSLLDLGIHVMAFIPGDEVKRGPIFEGLPTLESHRQLPPYIAFLDLIINHKIDSVLVGDITLSKEQSDLIKDYIKTGVISIPVQFEVGYEYLYNQVYTIRIDSPHQVMRLQESREYSCDGTKTEPFNCIERQSGSITMDNIGYQRYSGEIQIVREDLKQDARVNVIGHIEPNYLKIMQMIKNGKRIKFIR
jgi:uncharacterized protein